MANINNIKFNNFRNFTDYKLKFDNKLNIFFGNNGCGKTNILEGISLIAKGRGIRNSNIFDLIKRKEGNFFVNSNFCVNKLILVVVLDVLEEFTSPCCRGGV